MSRPDRLDGWQEPAPIVISEREARDALSAFVQPFERIPRSEFAAWWLTMNQISRLPNASVELRQAAGAWLRVANLSKKVHDSARGALSIQAAECPADERRKAV